MNNALIVSDKYIVDNMYRKQIREACVHSLNSHSALGRTDEIRARNVNIFMRRVDGESNKSIAKKVGLSTQRIRQLEAKLLRILRHPKSIMIDTFCDTLNLKHPCRPEKKPATTKKECFTSYADTHKQDILNNRIKYGIETIHHFYDSIGNSMFKFYSQEDIVTHGYHMGYHGDGKNIKEVIKCLIDERGYILKDVETREIRLN